MLPLGGKALSTGRRACRPEQPVGGGLLDADRVLETVLRRLSGAVLGVAWVQAVWTSEEWATDSRSSLVPCVHCADREEEGRGGEKTKFRRTVIPVISAW